MTGLTIKEARIWREEVRVRLRYKWEILSPTDMRYSGEYDAPDGTMSALTKDMREKLPSHLKPDSLVTMDEFFIDRADFLLCNFIGSDIASIGTMWEMGYAWAKGKKIVSIVDDGNIHDHPFVFRRSHVVVTNLEDAILYLDGLTQ